MRPVVAAPCFAIRRPAVAVFTLDDYVGSGIMSARQAELLRIAVRERKNVLVAGATSTGKTTLVNALLDEVAKTGDRVVLIVRMDLDTDVMRDEAHDALGVRGCDAAAGIFEAARQPVDPQATVGIEHHFDDARIFEIGGDRGAERGAQHARAAGESFRPEGDCRHMSPASSPQLRGGCQRG
jgi:DNA helicase HerA-like ATPase